MTVVNFSNRPQAVVIQVENARDFNVELKSGAQAARRPGLSDVTLGAFEWRIYSRTLKP